MGFREPGAKKRASHVADNHAAVYQRCHRLDVHLSRARKWKSKLQIIGSEATSVSLSAASL